MNIQGKINEIYTMVQELQIQPTEHNVTRLAGIMKGMKEVFAGMNLLQEQVRKLTAEIRELKPEETQEGQPENVVEMPAPENEGTEETADGE